MRRLRAFIVDSMTFKYRRKITITERSGNNLSDYQVRIDLDATNFDFSHFLNEGKDLRFTDASKNLLPYWVEKMDIAAEEATIWVRVPSIPANSSVDIWMYYGCAGLTSASSGCETFLFYDDFEQESFYYGLKYRGKAYTCLKPVMLGGRRFIVRSSGWGTGAGTLDIVEVSDDWETVINTWEAPFDAADTYARAFPNVFPDKIIVSGTDGSYGYITYFDINNESWGPKTTVSARYIVDVIYNDGDGLFYIGTPPGNNHASRAAPEDLFTPSNWELVNFPEWGGGDLMGSIMTAFKGNIYIIRRNYQYYWDVLKWDVSTDTFETLMYNYDSTTESGVANKFSFIRADDDTLVVTTTYYSPTKHWSVYYSEDGETFIKVVDLPFISEVNELQCWAYPYHDDILVSQTNWENEGYIKIYSKSGEIKQQIYNVNSHYSEAVILFDGDKAVIGSEGSSDNKREIKILPASLPWKVWIGDPTQNVERRPTTNLQGDYELHYVTGRDESQIDNFYSSLVDSNVAIEVLAYQNYGDDSLLVGSRCSGSGGYYNLLRGYYLRLPCSSSESMRIYRVDDGAISTLKEVAMSVKYYYEISMRLFGNKIRAIVRDADGNVIFDEVVEDSTYSQGNIINLAAPEWNASRNPSFDYVRVRKYTEPEPSVILGEEETA